MSIVTVDGAVVRRTVSVGVQGPPGAPAIPIGGTTGQPLAKLSNANLDADWANRVVLDELRVRTTPNETVTPQAGSIFWDDLDNSLAYQINGGINLDVGQENVVFVRNPAGGDALTKGTVVAVLGASANRLEVQPCDASASGGIGCRTLGVVIETIASPGFGFVSTFGLLRGFNTGNVIGGGVGEGSELFISTTPGVLSTQPAISPARRVTVGYVVTTGVQGSIFVTIRRGLTVNELDNVTITNPQVGDVLTFNGTQWVNQQP